MISGNCLGRVCVSEYPASRALAWRWPGRGPVAEPPRDLAKVIPLPRPRPVLAADFAELEIIPPTFNLALLDSEAMPVALSVIDVEPEPVPSSRNIFEAFADNLLQPVGNCRGWDRIAPGVKRIASDATRHFSRKYGRVLIAAANSCVRDAKRNREVGGAKFSAHLRGTALDFKIIAPDRSFTVGERELWLFCKSHRLAKGCGIYKMKGIIHADVDVRLGKRAWNWTGRRPTRLAKVKHKKKKYAKKKVKGKWRYASR